MWLALALGCSEQSPALDPESAGAPSDLGHRPPVFEEISATVGLDFVHFNGMSGEFYLPEEMGAGAALLDYDSDGDLDLYLLQGNLLGEGVTMADAVFPATQSLPLTDRLYANRLLETGSLRFEDVTEEAGIHSTGYGMGVATGDFDRNGALDLYITNYGANELWQNQGDGTFEEVSRTAGVDDERWGTSCAFLDFDRDGWLDLFVCNYVDFTFENHKECFSATSARDYCGPLSFDPLPDVLYHNRGDGTFADVTLDSRIGRQFGAALGVVTADYNHDGWIDVYVANDASANQLWINQKNKRFEDRALIAGCAINRIGLPEGSMGVDAGDFDNDGDLDLFMTHLVGETNTLYVNDGGGFFDDATIQSGLGVSSRGTTGFATRWFDYDNDGLLDLFIANGAVKVIERLAAAGDPFPLHEQNQLLHNDGNGRFHEVGQMAGEVMTLSEVSRGAAFGDLDNDGDTDIVVTNNAGPVRVLQNQVGQSNQWLGVELAGSEDRPTVLGALVCCQISAEQRMWRRVHSDASYLSANDLRVRFGLGEMNTVELVRVRWPNGDVEEWSLDGQAVGRYLLLKRGTGK